MAVIIAVVAIQPGLMGSQVFWVCGPILIWLREVKHLNVWNAHWAEGSLEAKTVLGLKQYLAYNKCSTHVYPIEYSMPLQDLSWSSWVEAILLPLETPNHLFLSTWAVGFKSESTLSLVSRDKQANFSPHLFLLIQGLNRIGSREPK